jgi:uncharacterized protein (TIGR02145 family)
MNNKRKDAVKGWYLMIGLLCLLITISSCKKPKPAEPEQETGTVTDRQGQVYKTVKIGDQWWMAENLRATMYADGSLINTPSSTDPPDTWENDTMGMYKGKFLYNWYAINNAKNMIPEGWRIPTDEDWKKLERYLGMSAAEADKASWRGTHEGEMLMSDINLPQVWGAYGDVWPTNTSGFNALPVGYVMFDGTNGDQKDPSLKSTFFWSSTLSGHEPWYRYLHYKNATIFRYHGPKTYGFSVRCILN